MRAPGREATEIVGETAADKRRPRAATGDLLESIGERAFVRVGREGMRRQLIPLVMNCRIGLRAGIGWIKTRDPLQCLVLPRSFWNLLLDAPFERSERGLRERFAARIDDAWQAGT